MKKLAILIATVVILSAFGSMYSLAENSPVVVTGVNWFGENSTAMAVPGMNNVPLFITMENGGPSIYNFTAYILLKYPFSYGYVINGSEEMEKTVISVPEFPSDSTIKIMQLVNISSNAPDGIYLQTLIAYGRYSPTYPVENLSSTFYIPLEGNVHLFVSASYIGENGQVINPVPGVNPVPLTLLIGNSGNVPATNLTFYFKPSYPFYGPGQSAELTGIEPYGYVPVTFMVNISQNIRNGYYPETIYYKYYNVTGSISFNFTWNSYYSINVITAYVGAGNSVIPAMGGMKNVPITVEIMNSGTEYASNVNVSFNPSYPFYGPIQTFNLPVLAPFQPETLVFFASIENGTADGIYNETMSFQVNNSQMVKEFSIDITGYSSIISDGSYINLNGTDMVAGPGMNDVPLTVLVSNAGNAVPENITFTYDPSYPFYGNPQTFTLPALPQFQPVKLTFVVNIYSNATDGIYAQKLLYHYGGYSGIVNFNAGIFGYSNITVQGYFKNPAYVYTNQTFNAITFSVINSGNAPAFNISLYATSGMEIINSPFTVSVLPPHIPFNFTIYYNSPQSSGTYNIYFHAGNMELTVPVNVLQAPNIAVKTNFPVLTPGESKVQVTFYVQNNGPGSIQSMQIHFVYPEVIDLYVSSDNPLGGLFLNNVTVADMKQGENFTLPYIIDVADNAVPGKYTGELVMLLFENNTLRPIMETFHFTFSISAPFFSTSGNTGVITLSNLTIIILVIIIIALVALYIRQVRKK